MGASQGQASLGARMSATDALAVQFDFPPLKASREQARFRQDSQAEPILIRKASLFAVVVLLVVGFWLHSQTEISRWKAFIHGKVQRALDGKNLWALAALVGVSPTWETLASQVVVLALVLVLWAYGKRPSSQGAFTP